MDWIFLAFPEERPKLLCSALSPAGEGREGRGSSFSVIPDPISLPRQVVSRGDPVQ
jgi:hypothetical protein